MEKMQTNHNKAVLVAAVLIVTASTGLTFAYAQTSEVEDVSTSTPTQERHVLSDDQKLQLKELQLAGDREGVMALMEEWGVEKPLRKGRGHRMKGFLKDLTDEQRTLAEETHQKVMAGEITHEEAHALLSAEGIELPERPEMTGEMQAKREAMREKHEALKAAMESGDYQAWLSAMEENFPDAPFLEDMTEEKFEVMQQIHELHEAGDHEGARALAEEAGLELPMRGKMGPGPGMHHEFMENLTDEQKEALKTAHESGDHEAVHELMESFKAELEA